MGPSIDVLGGRPCASRGRVDLGVVCPIGPMVSKAYFEEKCIRRVREKLRLFLYEQYIIGNVFSLAF